MESGQEKPNNTTENVNEFSTDEIGQYIYVYYTFTVLRAFLGIVPNMFTILAVMVFKSIRSPTTLCIASLALADVLLGFAAVLEAILVATGAEQISQFIVIFVIIKEFFNQSSALGNKSSLLWICLDRYMYITRPLRYFEIYTQGRVLKKLCVTWVLIFVIVPTIIITCSNLKSGPNYNGLRYIIKLNYTDESVYLIFVTLPSVASAVITISLYSSIAYLAQKHRRQILAFEVAVNPPEYERNARRKEYKITKMLAWVLAIYMLSSMPILVIHTIDNYVTLSAPAYINARRFFGVVYIFQSFINPFIYAKKNADFKNAYDKLLRRKHNI